MPGCAWNRSPAQVPLFRRWLAQVSPVSPLPSLVSHQIGHKTEKYGLKLEPPFRCDFRDPWGNRIQVVDLHDESLIWLLPYAEVQKVGIKF